MAVKCLPQFVIDDLKKKFRNNPNLFLELTEMNSKDRLQKFTELLGGSKEDGRFLATTFERALASKQLNALKKWGEKTFTPKERSSKEYSLVIRKLEAAEKRGLFNPDEAGNYLENFVSDIFKSDISIGEIETLKELSDNIKNTEVEMLKNKTNENITNYQLSILKAHDYIHELQPIKDKNFVGSILNLPKSIMSSLDFSAPFRQGFGMVGRKNFWQNLKPMLDYAFNKDNYDKIRANILTSPYYELSKSAGVRLSILAEKLSQREDAFMSTFLEKIPGFGKLFKGSERAYTGFLSKLRFDEFVRMVKLAELGGENVAKGSKALTDIGKIINDFTGSGNIGKNDKYSTAVPFLNALFFAPRKIFATMNMFNPQRYLDPRISKTARMAAARNLISMLGFSVSIISLYNAFVADDKEKTGGNPTSADFGKIKLGNTRIDVSGGNATYLTLLARIMSGKTTSSTNGKVTELGGKYGSPTRRDVAVSFLSNKLGPLPGYISTWLNDADWKKEGNFQAGKDTAELFLPMIITSIYDAINDEDTTAGNATLSALAELFGFGTNTYGNK